MNNNHLNQVYNVSYSSSLIKRHQ